MKYLKRLFPFLIFVFIFLTFVSCNLNTKNKNLLTLGINMELPKDMKIGFSESKVFKYNNTTIPSITIQGVSKKESILIKSFPFTVDDYKKHFKSAFEGENIKEIKYDYKEIKGNENIEKIYKSKAILSINNEKKYSYVYIISFKNSSGSLIVEITSNSNNDFSKYIKTIKNIKSNTNNIDFKEYQNSVSEKDVVIVEDISVKMPSYVKVKTSYTKSAYYINGFSENKSFYIIASKNKPLETNNLTWNNINGYEVIKKFDDNNYLIHDINTQKIFYLNTEIKEVVSSSGNKYYLRIEKLWK